MLNAHTMNVTSNLHRAHPLNALLTQRYVLQNMSSPLKSPVTGHGDFLIPSPMPTKRTRTISQYVLLRLLPQPHHYPTPHTLAQV